MQQLRLKFLKECEANVELVRSSLESMAAGHTQAETLQDLYRGVHSIKGGAGFFDLDRIEWLAGEMEGVCARLVSGSLAPSADLVSALTRAEVALAGLVDTAQSGLDLIPGFEKAAGQTLQALAS